jgi:hypothetical protein
MFDATILALQKILGDDPLLKILFGLFVIMVNGIVIGIGTYIGTHQGKRIIDKYKMNHPIKEESTISKILNEPLKTPTIRIKQGSLKLEKEIIENDNEIEAIKEAPPKED